MRRFRSLLCSFLLLLGLWPVAAQELRNEATPFSVWLDFERLADARWQRVGPPAWLESVRSEPAKDPDGRPATLYRLRFNGLRNLDNELQLRLFFQDRPDAEPVLSGWSETGTQRFVSDPLGNKLDLPTSETLCFPTTGLDYIEIRVPGDGRNIRGVFLTTLETQPMRRALDFEPAGDLIDAFGNAPATVSPADDLALLGRVRATLDSGITKLSPPQTVSATWEFNLQSPPEIAVVILEVLNFDALAPLDVVVNDRPLGQIQAQLPDLADPGYLVSPRPLADGPHFRYSGWLRCQKAIPAAALRQGENKIVFSLPREAGPVAVRAVELQLKHPIKNVQYRLPPVLPLP